MQQLKDQSGVPHFIFYLYTTDRTGRAGRRDGLH